MTDTDSNALLNAVIPFAQQMRAKRGTFLPFGATVSVSGDVVLAAGPPDVAGEEALIDFFVSLFRQQASGGQIRGSALCYDARVSTPGSTAKREAICVEVEHVTDRCVRLFLPYTRGFLKRLTYGQIFGSPQSPRVFRVSMNPLDEWDDAGMTPLMIAVFNGDQDEVRRLLQAGADPDRPIAGGTTPLWHAEDDFGLTEVAAILREYGAKVKHD